MKIELPPFPFLSLYSFDWIEFAPDVKTAATYRPFCLQHHLADISEGQSEIFLVSPRFDNSGPPDYLPLCFQITHHPKIVIPAPKAILGCLVGTYFHGTDPYNTDALSFCDRDGALLAGKDGLEAPLLYPEGFAAAYRRMTEGQTEGLNLAFVQRQNALAYLSQQIRFDAAQRRARRPIDRFHRADYEERALAAASSKGEPDTTKEEKTDLLHGDYPREILNLKAGLQLALKDIVGDDKAGDYLVLPRLPESVMLQALAKYRRDYRKINTFYERYLDPKTSNYAQSPSTAAVARRHLRQDRALIERLDRLVKIMNETKDLPKLGRAYREASGLLGNADTLFPRPDCFPFVRKKLKINKLSPISCP